MKDDSARVAGSWEGLGKGNRYASSRWSSGRRRERDPRHIGALLSSLPRERDDAEVTVLDAPCGSGRLTAALAARADRLWGADLSGSMLAEAQRSARELSQISATGEEVPAGVLQADASRLPFRDGSFDVVVCCRLLHHLGRADDRRAVLRELARVARSHLILTYWDEASWAEQRRRLPLLRALRERRGRRIDSRTAIRAAELDADLDSVGARALRRRWSARFLSAQTYVLAAVER